MCLIANTVETKDILRRIKNGKVRFWKMFEVDTKGNLYSPYYRRNKVVKAGWMISDRRGKGIGKNYKSIWDESVIDRGIHVYNNVKRATLKSKAVYLWDSTRAMRVIPVYVKADDFVASGGGQSVFMKVWINKKDLKA